MKNKTKIFLFLSALFAFINQTKAAQIDAAQSGNWSAASTWVGGVVPTANDQVVINSNYTVTVDNTAPAVCNDIQLAILSSLGNGTLVFNAGSQLTCRQMNIGWSGIAHGVIDMTLGGTFISKKWLHTAASVNSSFIPGIGKVIFTGGMPFSLPANANFDEFYDLEIVGGALITLSRDITVARDLALTTGFFNLAGNILTLGSSGAASTLTRTASTITNWMYGGTFKRFWLASTAITSNSGNYYGLFPIGTSTASAGYRPVEINSTVSPTAGGYFTVNHVDATGVLDLIPVYNDAGTNIVRIHNAQFITTISGVTGGTYNIDVTMTGLPSLGNVNDIRLAVFTGGTTANAVGTHAVSTGTTANPTAKRTGITTLTDFNNDFRISTTNAVVTPLVTPLSVELIDFNAFQENNIISVYPNPGSEYIQYIVDSENGGAVTVKVIDVLGREVISNTETLEGGVATKKLSIASLASGRYLLQITTGKQFATANPSSGGEKMQKQFVVK